MRWCFLRVKSECMSKPLSAPVTPCGWMMSRNPLTRVMRGSVILPPYPDDANENAPHPVTAPKNFTVVRCLYSDLRISWINNGEGSGPPHAAVQPTRVHCA